MAQLMTSSFDPHAALASLGQGRSDFGAFASFVGYVRDSDGALIALRLQHYSGYTEKWMDKIEGEAKARFDVLDALVIHRSGELKPGEPIVLVGAIASHRKTAFAFVDYVMDRLKTEAPFWKQEIKTTGEVWVEPRTQDYIARNAWDKQDG